MEKTVYIIIKAKISSDLTEEEAIDELTMGTQYSIGSTDNVKVKGTELMEISNDYQSY